MILSYEEDALKIVYKNFSVDNYLVGIAFQQKISTLPNRTYTSKMELSNKSKNPYAITSFNALGSDGIIQLTSETDSKSSESSKVVTYTVADNDGTPIYFSKELLIVQLKYAEQWKQVDALFTSLGYAELASGVTKDTINQAKAMVNSITDNKDATEMNEALAKADALYEKKLVDELDSLLNNGQLTPGTSQEDLDNLQNLINQLPDGDKKQEL